MNERDDIAADTAPRGAPPRVPKFGGGGNMRGRGGEHYGDRGKSNLRADALFLNAICGKLAAMRIAGLPHYLITGALQGAGDSDTNPPTHSPLSVQVLLDTRAVLDNYCSKAVRNWVRQHWPQCWHAAGNAEDVALACLGTKARPSSTCHINLSLENDKGTIVCSLINIKATILDLGVDSLKVKHEI
jgi:hypothetical protein